jgi:hypothetical protein
MDQQEKLFRAACASLGLSETDIDDIVTYVREYEINLKNAAAAIDAFGGQSDTVADMRVTCINNVLKKLTLEYGTENLAPDHFAYITFYCYHGFPAEQIAVVVALLAVWPATRNRLEQMQVDIDTISEIAKLMLCVKFKNATEMIDAAQDPAFFEKIAMR